MKSKKKTTNGGTPNGQENTENKDITFQISEILFNRYMI